MGVEVHKFVRITRTIKDKTRLYYAACHSDDTIRFITDCDQYIGTLFLQDGCLDSVLRQAKETFGYNDWKVDKKNVLYAVYDNNSDKYLNIEDEMNWEYSDVLFTQNEYIPEGYLSEDEKDVARIVADLNQPDENNIPGLTEQLNNLEIACENLLTFIKDKRKNK